MLRRIFGSKRDKATGEWRNLHDKELIIRVIKSSRLRWAEHVARMERAEVYTGFWWGNLRERDHLVDPDVDGRIILKWIFRKWEGKAWTGLD